MAHIFRCFSRGRNTLGTTFVNQITKQTLRNFVRSVSCTSHPQPQVSQVCTDPRAVFPALLRTSNTHCLTVRFAGDFSGAPPTHDADCQLSDIEYEDICEETLESIGDAFETLVDSDLGSDEYDVAYSGGVLTVKLGGHGTYVINKQTPNKQIWLSSPVSGPKRYDYRAGVWVYKHDEVILHELLSAEISEALGSPVDFSSCSYGKQD